MSEPADSDLREKEALIRQLELANLRAFESIKHANRLRGTPSLRYAPFMLVAAGVGIAAAIFGAAAALLKWLH